MAKDSVCHPFSNLYICTTLFLLPKLILRRCFHPLFEVFEVISLSLQYSIVSRGFEQFLFVVRSTLNVQQKLTLAHFVHGRIFCQLMKKNGEFTKLPPSVCMSCLSCLSVCLLPFSIEISRERYSSGCDPTDLFTILEPQNPSIDVSELQKIGN